MSFAPFNSKEKNPYDKYENKKFNKKEKFVNEQKKNFYCDTPGFWEYEKKWDVVDAESNLISPGVGTRAKTKVEMVENLHPNNYAIPVGNKVATKESEAFYFPGYDTGPGRGFGNLNISNSIRVGDYTRTETKNFKATKESEMIERWEFIDDRFANPNHLVMEIPRGGNSTRKNQTDLNNSMVRLSEDKEFNFQY
jgi:hypothetical protein